MELEDGFCGSITSDLGEGQTIKSTTQDYVEVGFADGFKTDDENGGITWE